MLNCLVVETTKTNGAFSTNYFRRKFLSLQWLYPLPPPSKKKNAVRMHFIEDSFIINYQYAEWHHNNFKAFPPGKTAYDTDRGSCCCTKSSFTQALKPVLFMYWRKQRRSNQRELAAKSCRVAVGRSQKRSYWHRLTPIGVGFNCLFIC